MATYFKDNPQGVLVAIDQLSADENVYSVWFPYTKTFVGQIRAGDFIAVRNYAGIGNEGQFSILEIVSAMPTHYALGTSSTDTERAFPGFVIEAAKNAKVDWEQEEPVEQTTKIKAEAISTGLQLVMDMKGEGKIVSDDNLPMVGEDAHLFTDEQINQIINQGLTDNNIPTIEPCKLILNDKIAVKLSTEDLLKTHFGVFGFTGAGKSNLMSDLIYNLMTANENNKIMLFDLATEYSALLVDLLHKYENACILCTDENSVPGSEAVMKYLKGDQNKLDEAAESIVRTLLLPKELLPQRQKYIPLFKEILKQKKIKIFDTGSEMPTVSNFMDEVQKAKQGKIGNSELYITTMIESHFGGSGVDPVTLDELRALEGEVEQCIQQNNVRDYVTNSQASGQQLEIGDTATTSRASSGTVVVSDTAKTWLIAIRRIINRYSGNSNREALPEDITLSLSQMYQKFADTKKQTLIIVQSNRDDDLRTFSHRIVNYVFKTRKVNGTIHPYITFLYDEADEFIPQGAKDSYAESLEACTLLARRGRKLGMGLGIATQRVAYIDTSILAQPHTFFLSKLPRAYDREQIGKAFGASEQMINRTLSFTKGQWMLFSYDATGLTSIPLPVKFPNANQRLKDYFTAASV